MARKRVAAHGGHGWFVTFADLMALLMSFFVMVAAFSSQDKAEDPDRCRLDARGLRHAARHALHRHCRGQDGLPTRPTAEERRARSTPRRRRTRRARTTTAPEGWG